MHYPRSDHLKSPLITSSPRPFSRPKPLSHRTTKDVNKSLTREKSSKMEQHANDKDRKLSSDLNLLHRILQSGKVKERTKLTKLGSQKKLKLHLEKHVKLNEEVDAIASMKKLSVPETEAKSLLVNKSQNIIHNRINKAGSTSMMGRIL